ncbi:MAG: 50S ribosomal protein L22 [candidate division Zixibacteria bacterium]|nr:50S ribosomal protein L22 [candidate division Zixibacteria bacterium]
MEAVARARFSRGSARKVRRVVELIKDKNVEEALNILSFVPKYAAQYIEKILKSATANAISQEGTAKLKAEDLYIKKIFVDGGPMMKRIRPSSMGRAYQIRKRTNHLTIIVSDEIEGKKKKEVKEFEKKKKEKVEEGKKEKKKVRKEVKKKLPKENKG